jgi:hypothetical protein
MGKKQVHVHDHIATLQRLFERAARESRTENEAAPAQVLVLNVHEIHINALGGAGRGSAAGRYVDDLSPKVSLDPAEVPLSLFDLHENLTAD